MGLGNLKEVSRSSVGDWGEDAQALIAAQAGKPCIFPFKHDGVTHNKCKVIFGDVPICSTRVDSDGNHVDGHWGFCDCNCPAEGKLSGMHIS